MLKKRFIWFVMIMLGMGLFITSCGSSSDNKKLAPNSVQGKTYQMLVTSGTPPLANTGTAAIVFAADGNYIVTGDANIANDQGTYTYNRVTNDSGEVILTSTQIPGLQINYAFVFTQEGTGNFTGTLASDPAVTQQGTFTEL